MVQDIKPNVVEKDGIARYDSEWEFDVSGWTVGDGEEYLTAQARTDLKTLRHIVARNAKQYPSSIKEMSPDALKTLPLKEWQKAIKALSKAVIATFQPEE